MGEAEKIKSLEACQPEKQEKKGLVQEINQ